MCACASLISLPAFFSSSVLLSLWLYLSVPLPLYLSSSLALSLFLLLFPSFFPSPSPLLASSPLFLFSLSTLYKCLSPFSLTHPMTHKMHIKKTKTARGMRARRRGGRRRGRTLVYHTLGIASNLSFGRKRSSNFFSLFSSPHWSQDKARVSLLRRGGEYLTWH